MIATWGEWKRYPKATLGERLEAPIGPGIYEVIHAESGELFAFGATDNLAEALSSISAERKSIASWFSRREAAKLPDLEYRTCVTATKSAAKIAAERMLGRREAYMRGAA
jgi:hypothetical protein